VVLEEAMVELVSDEPLLSEEENGGATEILIRESEMSNADAVQYSKE
jgi:hypothetical protein